MKRAEERDELVVRLLNESPEPQRASVRPYRAPERAFRLDIGEEVEDALRIVDGAVELELGPWQIRTIGFEFGA